ncbi:MAG: type IV pilus assembly protein PilM [Oligosphaeraceae bacterium]
MAKNERFLSVDIGAAAIKMGEFEFDQTGGMRMINFAHREYEEEISEDNRIRVIEGVLRQMLLEANIHTSRTMLSISGQTALIRFGQLNNLKNDRKQIRQLAEFEATRNLPFPLDQISMDFQLIASNDDALDTMDVLSVVVKKDIVEQIVQAVRRVGLSPQLVDVAPVACYNAARANGLGGEGCVVLVSIGGRSTNLMFLEGNRFYARTIPIAGHSITQQIARKFSIGQPEAEELKRRHGFVARSEEDGGSETSGDVSKIVRQVMMRLFGEISRSISIYKTQQHGSDPVKVYLTGGSTILTYCDQFFAEKFALPVEYFNPLGCIALDSAIDRQRLSEVAHTFSEVVGLALRYSSTCPVEINLLPKEVASQQSLHYKKPYFVGSMFTLLVMFALIYLGMQEALKETKAQRAEYEQVQARYKPAYEEIKRAVGDAEGALGQVNDQKGFLLQRAKWPMILEEIFRARPDNVWIDSIEPVFGDLPAIEQMSIVEEEGSASGGADDMFSMGGMGGMGGGDSMSMSMDGGGDMFGGSTSNLPSLTTIGGVNIQAHTIRQKGDSFGVDPVLAREPAYPFEVPEKEDASEEVEEEAQYDDEGNEIIRSADPDYQDQSGELLFVRNLKKSQLFSAEEEYTGVVSIQKNEYLENGNDFQIQLKFNVLVEAYPWSQSTTSSGGMGGARGGMN